MDRLRLVDYLERHPAVLAKASGRRHHYRSAARGGSTLLQRLLTTSSQLTSTWFWEGITPLPLSADEAGPAGFRRKEIRLRSRRRVMAAAWPEHEESVQSDRRRASRSRRRRCSHTRSSA
mgnify:CR=1 FL=1